MKTQHDAYAWVKENEEWLVAQSKERQRQENAERVARYTKERWGNDPAYKRMLAFRSRFTSCLLRKWAGGAPPTREMQTSKRLFGCSWEQFRHAIEEQFQPGMTWENHGRGPDKWCLDHIKPICLFDWWTWEGLKEAFHWTNVQPLWGWQHRAKTDWDNSQARRRAMEGGEYAARLKPRGLPPLEGTDEEIMAKLEAQLNPQT